MSTHNFDVEFSTRSLRGQAVRGAAAKIVSQAGSSVVQLVGGIIVARLLVPADFGLVAMVTAYTMILADVGDLGLAQSIVQAEKITHEQVSALFWLNVVLGVGVAVVFVGVAPLLVWFYDEPRLLPIAAVLSTTFVLRGLSAQHMGLLSRSMRFPQLAAIDMTAALVSVAGSIAMAWSGWGYWALVSRRLLLFAVSAAGAWWFSKWRPGFHRRAPGTRPLVQYGVHSFGSQCLFNVRQSMDKILLGWRFGAIPLGLYERAQQLFVRPFTQLTSPLAAVAVSTLSRLRTEPDRFLRYYLQAVSVIAFVGMGLSAVFTVSGRDLVVLLLGARWRDSGDIFVAFAPSLGLLLLSGTQNWLHLSLGRADRSFRWSIIVLIVSAVTLGIGLVFGPVAVALAYTASLYLLFLPGFKYAGEPINLRTTLIVSAIWRYFAAAAISAGVSWYLLEGSALAGYVETFGVFARVVVESTLCGLLYMGCTVIFHGGFEPLVRFVSLAQDLMPTRRRAAVSSAIAVTDAPQ